MYVILITETLSPQVAPMDAMAMKRSQLYSMANSPYSQQQQQQPQPGGAYSGQPYGAPAPHRYPMGMQGRGQVGMGALQYHHQQVRTVPSMKPGFLLLLKSEGYVHVRD